VSELFLGTLYKVFPIFKNDTAHLSFYLANMETENQKGYVAKLKRSRAGIKI
jgi:hypothetical protein